MNQQNRYEIDPSYHYGLSYELVYKDSFCKTLGTTEH